MNEQQYAELGLPTVGELVKDRTVEFQFFRDGELWYRVKGPAPAFSFPVPVTDTGKGIFKNKDKAVYFMRWIRKHLESIAQGQSEQVQP